MQGAAMVGGVAANVAGKAINTGERLAGFTTDSVANMVTVSIISTFVTNTMALTGQTVF